MRWLFHATTRAAALGATSSDDAAPYAPASLAREGFVHASFRDDVRESVRLYLPPPADVVVLQIDPRLLDVAHDVALTPRGPMPHIHGRVPRGAIRALLELDDLDGAPDFIDDAPPT